MNRDALTATAKAIAENNKEVHPGVLTELRAAIGLCPRQGTLATSTVYTGKVHRGLVDVAGVNNEDIITYNIEIVCCCDPEKNSGASKTQNGKSAAVALTLAWLRMVLWFSKATRLQLLAYGRHAQWVLEQVIGMLPAADSARVKLGHVRHPAAGLVNEMDTDSLTQVRKWKRRPQEPGIAEVLGAFFGEDPAVLAEKFKTAIKDGRLLKIYRKWGRRVFTLEQCSLGKITLSIKIYSLHFLAVSHRPVQILPFCNQQHSLNYS